MKRQQSLASLIEQLVCDVGDRHRDLLEVPSLRTARALAERFNEAGTALTAWLDEREARVNRRWSTHRAHGRGDRAA